jgi:AraC-like DNA-binding protein
MVSLEFLINSTGRSSLALARSVFDTNLIPEKQRVSSWRDNATSVWDINKITDEQFFARVSAYHSADLLFGTVESSQQKTERVGSRIAADNLDYYMLQFYVSGERSATTRGKEAVASRGDMLVLDMTQPIKTESTTYKSFDLVMPRRLLDPLLANPDDHAGRRMEANLPLTALLRSHVLALYRNASKMTEAEAIAMQGPTLALAAAVLNGAVSEEHAASVRSATWLAVRRYIEDNLGDLTMNIDTVALQFGISRATLYRIMEPVRGFVSYVRMRRLYRCREELASPASHRHNISVIAAGWGFPNASSFSALFQRTFGMSPRDYREVAFGKAMATTESASQRDWSRWLAAMR